MVKANKEGAKRSPRRSSPCVLSPEYRTRCPICKSLLVNASSGAVCMEKELHGRIYPKLTAADNAYANRFYLNRRLPEAIKTNARIRKETTERLTDKKRQPVLRAVFTLNGISGSFVRIRRTGIRHKHAADTVLGRNDKYYVWEFVEIEEADIFPKRQGKAKK